MTCSPAVVVQAAMTGCGCHLVEFGVAPFFLFSFLFLPLKNTISHSHNVPTQTIPRRPTIASTTKLCSCIRCPPTRSCPLIRSARSPVARVPVARGTWSPASQSRYNTVLQFFLLLPIFACLLLHVEETGCYIFIKQIISTPKVYAFLKSPIVNLPMVRPLPHPRPCDYLLLVIFPIILPHQLAPTVATPRLRRFRIASVHSLSRIGASSPVSTGHRSSRFIHFRSKFIEHGDTSCRRQM